MVVLAVSLDSFNARDQNLHSLHDFLTISEAFVPIKYLPLTRSRMNFLK